MDKLAKLGVNYDYSSTQLLLDEELSNDILTFISDMIDPEDVEEAAGGKENNPHITVLYGINEDEDQGKIRQAIESVGDLEFVKFLGLDLFEAQDNDVLIVKIELDAKLEALHDKIEELFPGYKQTHPDYKPHLTLAYMKKGQARKYIDEYSQDFMDEQVPVEWLEFSSTDPENNTRVQTFKRASKVKLSYVQHVPGHKNSRGEAAPWVVKQHRTGKILSSHRTEAEAKAHLKQMEQHKHMGGLVLPDNETH